MPTTVIVVFRAVNVEPTFNLFLLAREAPTTATSDFDVEEKAWPDVNFSVPPPFAPPTRALPGLFVPITRTGIDPPVPLGPPLPLPPPNCDPNVPAGVGDVSVVFEEDNCSLRDSCRAVTWGNEISALTLVSVNGVPPPLNPKKPLGATVIVLPVEARTELIFELTASRAINMEIDSVMATAKITTTPIERIELRNALRTPRRREFTGQPFENESRYLAEEVKGWLQVRLSQL